MKTAPAIAVLIAIAVVAAVGARTVAQYSHARLKNWAQFGDSSVIQAAPVDAKIPGLTPTPTKGRPRVVLVLVDGLGVADMPRMPMLEHLARTGASLAARVPEPAWPISSWATALQGIPPADHGFLLPDSPAPLSPPNLLSILRDARLSVAAAGGDDFLTLAGPYLDKGAFSVRAGPEVPDTAVPAGAKAALTSGADLVILHLEVLHALAHRIKSGLNGSRSFARAPDHPQHPAVLWQDGLAWVDALLTQVAGDLNLNQTTLIVAGSFAAGLDGSHGASRPVPLVLNGPGVLAGTEGESSLQALAPSVAGLLGQVWPRAGTRARPQPRDLSERLKAWWQYGQEELPWAAGGAALYGLFVILTVRQPFARRLWTAVGLYFVVWHLIFWASGGAYSLDLPGLEATGSDYWQQRILEVVITMIPVAGLLGWNLGRHGVIPSPSRRRRRGRGRVTEDTVPEGPRPVRVGYAGLITLHATLALMGALGLQGLLLIAATGWDPVARWPGSSWVVKYFLDLGQMMVLGFASPLWVAAAILAAATGRAVRGDETLTPPGPEPHLDGDRAAGPRQGRPVIRMAGRRRRE